MTIRLLTNSPFNRLGVGVTGGVGDGVKVGVGVGLWVGGMGVEVRGRGKGVAVMVGEDGAVSGWETAVWVGTAVSVPN
jgi:hypothetical protein